MKKTILASLVVVVAAVGARAAHATGGDVERVVVFADRAEVTRGAVAACKDGAAAVSFVGVPDAIDARAVRGEADGDAVVVGVSTRVDELVESRDAEVAQLQKDIQALDDQLVRLDRAQADDDERAATWSSYGPYLRTLLGEDLRNPKPDLSRWDTLLSTLTSESQAASTARVARAAERRDVSRKLERLENRLARLSPSAAPQNVVATVAVRCGSSASPRVRLSYVVPGASWHPEYDLRFTGPAGQKTGAGKAVLTVAGVVTQASGEDWNDVEVWLSTSKPRLGGEAPLPNPIYVYGQEETKQKTLVQAQEERAQDLHQATAGGKAAASADLDDGGKAFVLKLPRRVTIKADGRPYWFPVDDTTTNATSALVALPALSPKVFQTVTWSNPAAYPLLDGVVHVFRGATFVGDEQLPYRAPGEAIELSLGLDEEIALERQDLLQQKREAGLLSGTQTLAQAWRTTLRNRSDKDVVVEIREQIPVSKSADITVDLKSEDTTGGYSLDKLRGHLTWQVTLKKGASEKRDVSFTIGVPKDWAVR